VLQGDYGANELADVTGWYLRDVPRCTDERPAYYVAAWSAKKYAIPEDYHLFGYVAVDGIRKSAIYSREPVVGPPQDFDLNTFAGAYDARPVTNLAFQRLLDVPVPQYPVRTRWEGNVELLGYDLDQRALTPLRPTTLMLYWQAHAAIDPHYQPFVEVLDGQGTLVTTGTPYCGSERPTTIGPNQPASTAFTLTGGAHVPPGTYTLRVGLRHTQTGAVLPTADGVPALAVGTLTVR
jgi:hypothetical protein